MSDLQIAMSRRDKNDYFLSVAKTIAFGSKCAEGKQHGAIAVKNQRMISTGYNGPPSGMDHCGKVCKLEEYKLKNNGKKDFSVCPAVHAEINVVVTAAMTGIAIHQAVLYVTKAPCPDCLKALKNLQLAAVMYASDEDNGDHFLLLGPGLTQEVKLAY